MCATRRKERSRLAARRAKLAGERSGNSSPKIKSEKQTLYSRFRLNDTLPLYSIQHNSRRTLARMAPIEEANTMARFCSSLRERSEWTVTVMQLQHQQKTRWQGKMRTTDGRCELIRYGV